MRMYPLQGLVPYKGVVCRIVGRVSDNETVLYTLLESRSHAESNLHVVSHTRLLEAIKTYARWKEDDRVHFDRHPTTVRVVDRRWDFKRGTVIYGFTDMIKVYRTQEQLMEVAEHHARLAALPLPEIDDLL